MDRRRSACRADTVLGNRLDKALDLFDAAIRFEPAARYLILQRSRVVDKWPLS